jgi:hypothetical protein
LANIRAKQTETKARDAEKAQGSRGGGRSFLSCPPVSADPRQADLNATRERWRGRDDWDWFLR